MCSDLSRTRGLRSALALGLILAATGAVRAQPRPSWVDPPARATPGAPAPKVDAPKPDALKVDALEAEPQPQAQRSPVPKPSVQESPVQEAPVREPVLPAAADQGPKPDPDQARSAGGVMPEAEAAAMAGPSRRAERPRLHRRSARRLSDTPAAAALTVAPKIPSGSREAASDPRFSDWAGQAQGLTEDYLASFSRPNGAMVSGAGRFYAPRLRFHGRMTTLAALLDEKRRFAERWPERRYEPRDTRTACNAALQSCVVRTLVDFRAGSPARGARSQGVAELVLEVSFAGGRPAIVSETSRVLRRGATVGALSGAGANG